VRTGWIADVVDDAHSKGGFLFSRAALPLLLKATNLEHPPTLIFTSATAAMKGSAQCSSFSTGKFAMRSLAQSLAREFGPQGVHVAHAIIDGVIDIERTKEFNVGDGRPDAKIKPEAVSLMIRCISRGRRRSQGQGLC
jgi:NAD(P)-dependent dehydrogenase (short-subunit alcohol dehydrogenase family)